MKGNGRKNKAAVFLALGLAVCSGIPVYAYEGTQMIRADEHTVDTWNLGDDDIIIYSNFAHRFCLCTLKIQYLAGIRLSKFHFLPYAA